MDGKKVPLPKSPGPGIRNPRDKPVQSMGEQPRYTIMNIKVNPQENGYFP
jgi:hypothetical protein